MFASELASVHAQIVRQAVRLPSVSEDYFRDALIPGVREVRCDEDDDEDDDDDVVLGKSGIT